MIELYKNIKAKRIELGMTQDELAKKLGYSGKSMIAKIESGKVDLSQSKIIAFANALDTDPGELMGETASKKRIVHVTNPTLKYNTQNQHEQIDRKDGLSEDMVSKSHSKYTFTLDKEMLINALIGTTSTLNKDGIKRIMEYAKELNDIEKYKDK